MDFKPIKEMVLNQVKDQIKVYTKKVTNHIKSMIVAFILLGMSFLLFVVGIILLFLQSSGYQIWVSGTVSAVSLLIMIFCLIKIRK